MIAEWLSKQRKAEGTIVEGLNGLTQKRKKNK
jgi:hypothetical protein